MQAPRSHVQRCTAPWCRRRTQQHRAWPPPAGSAAAPARSPGCDLRMHARAAKGGGRLGTGRVRTLLSPEAAAFGQARTRSQGGGGSDNAKTHARAYARGGVLNKAQVVAAAWGAQARHAKHQTLPGARSPASSCLAAVASTRTMSSGPADTCAAHQQRANRHTIPRLWHHSLPVAPFEHTHPNAGHSQAQL